MSAVDFASLEDGPDLPWHVDPRDRDPVSELARQQAMVALCRRSPGVGVFAVPNAAKRTQWAAARVKKEGLAAGALDLVIFWSRGVAFVEVKDGAGRPTPNQRDMLNALHRAGHHCGVFRTAASLSAWLRERGCPVAEVRA